jgi:hypothetical protein
MSNSQFWFTYTQDERAKLNKLNIFVPQKWYQAIYFSFLSFFSLKKKKRDRDLLYCLGWPWTLGLN